MDAGVNLAGLRRHIQGLETASGRSVGLAEGLTTKPRLSLGHPEIDERFHDEGLAWGTHELAASPGDPAASRAFAFMVLARYLTLRPSACALIVQEASALRELGCVYGAGLHALGLDPSRLVFIKTPCASDALRAISDALNARVPDILLADLWDGAALADLSLTRRFNLAAQKAQTLVLMTTPDLSSTSAALTRWRVTSASSEAAKDWLGAPALVVDLVRNRYGRTGRWTLTWNSHDRTFQAPSASKLDAVVKRTGAPLASSLVSPPFNRSGQAQTKSAGLAVGAYRQTG